MYTYHIRASRRNRKDSEEMILGIVVLVLLVVCGLAQVPVPSRMAGRDPSLNFQLERLHATHVQELRTRDHALEDEIKRLSRALDGTRADLASFRQVHDSLITQVATATTRLQELEATLHDSKAQAGKLKEYASLQEQLKKERDEAVSQAHNAAERIRELTLKLQRAGVYP